MKIYIVVGGWDYEGFENVLAFDDAEVAEDYATYLFEQEDNSYDYTDVQEVEVM